MITATILSLILAMFGETAPAQSFDCSNARTAVEKMICANPELSELDENLGRYFEAAKFSVPGSEICLRPDQAEWLKLRDRCSTASCLRNAYLSRLSELDPLQPGATAIKRFELPRGKSLVWIIPPAADRVAAPPNPKATAAEATGTLIDELARNPNTDFGFSLRAKDGAVHYILPLMLLEPPAVSRLQSLSHDTNATFLMRGYATRDTQGRTYFEPSRCAFVYRLP